MASSHPSASKVGGSSHEEGTEKPPQHRFAQNHRCETTYRVRGLPHDVDRETTKDLIASLLLVDDVVVHSLADDASGNAEKVATVQFKSIVPNLLNSDDDQWTVVGTYRKDPDQRHVTLYFDTHYDGFTPLYTPAPQEDYEYDFIAIHGLGGHALGSWKDRKSSYVWLRDALPRDLPKARVLTYGYHSGIVESESFETIDDIAAHFCALLKDVRKMPATRKKPIIFAAHDFGGLALKSAIGLMQDGSEGDKMCLRSTYAILCFGVPNQGMDTSHILAMIRGREIVPLFLSLSKNPYALRPLNQKFNSAFNFKDSTVLSFFETQTSSTMQQGPSGKPEMTGKRVVLVNWWSANNGREGMKEPIISIGRDHSNMIKFSEKDNYYIVVRNHIQNLAPNAATVISSRHKQLGPTHLMTMMMMIVLALHDPTTFIAWLCVMWLERYCL